MFSDHPHCGGSNLRMCREQAGALSSMLIPQQNALASKSFAYRPLNERALARNALASCLLLLDTSRYLRAKYMLDVQLVQAMATVLGACYG